MRSQSQEFRARKTHSTSWQSTSSSLSDALGIFFHQFSFLHFHSSSLHRQPLLQWMLSGAAWSLGSGTKPIVLWPCACRSLRGGAGRRGRPGMTAGSVSGSSGRSLSDSGSSYLISAEPSRPILLRISKKSFPAWSSPSAFTRYEPSRLVFLVLFAVLDFGMCFWCYCDEDDGTHAVKNVKLWSWFFFVVNCVAEALLFYESRGEAWIIIVISCSIWNFWSCWCIARGTDHFLCLEKCYPTSGGSRLILMT